MKNNEINISKDLLYVKATLDLTEDGLAKFFGVTRMTLNRWLDGEFNATKENLEKIYNQIYQEGIELNYIKEELHKSLERKDNLILFHGAKNDLIGKPSIKYGEKNRDFGKGFYLGESVKQSVSFVSLYENSSLYIFNFNKKGTKIKEFNVDRDWMLLIAYFRGRINNYKDSKIITNLLKELEGVDVVVAPIADNTMYSILNDFIGGTITDKQCLNALSANRLGKQYVFLNDKVINTNLTLLEKCYICEKEKDHIVEEKTRDDITGRAKVKLALREYAGKGKYIEDLLK